jgi:Mn-dependent DtxR family transcriptional regulator
MISAELMKYLKNRAHSQGITQKMIAEHFNVSIPTVKRWYAGSGLSLEQANEICNYLGIPLGQALISIKNTSDSFQYTLEQEIFFSTNPDYLAFFDNLLRGKSVNRIAKKFTLSNTKVTKYLIKLDKLGLIELHPNNKIKLLVKGEPVWRKNGPLVKSFKQKILDSFLSTKSSVVDKFHLYDLTAEDIKLITKNIEELLNFSSRASNRSAISNHKSKSYGFQISLKEFRWSLDNFL